MRAASPTKDQRGVLRGPCMSDGCYCDSYERPSTGHQCDYCEHPPTKHQDMGGSAARRTILSPQTAVLKCCKFPNCSKHVFVESNGHAHEFCSRGHAKQYMNLSPMVEILAQSDPKYVEIKTQFINKWLHNIPKGKVVSIVKIHSPQVRARMENYQKKVAAAHPNLKIYGSGTTANTHRRFHGTPAINFKCGLGQNGNSTLCNSAATNCSVCSIITSGLLLSKKQTNHAFARFGSGLYLSATSSKSHSYTVPADPSNPKKRVMFLCYVVVGLGKKLKKDDKTLIAAPQGYDSVLGETGDSLNYDEVVVYEQDAVCPAYLR